MIEEKVEKTTKEILASQLSAAQKIKSMNLTLIPAVYYITTNIYADEKRATALKRCREIDKNIRDSLIKKNMKGRTTSNASVYVGREKGGLGLRSVGHEAELGFIRRGMYLGEHEEMKDARRRYLAMRRAGWTNPMTDLEHVLEKYGLNIDTESGSGMKENVKKTVREATKKYQNQLMQEWTININ